MAQVFAALLTLALLGSFSVVVARLTAKSARTLWLSVFTVVVAGGITMMITHSYVTRWGIRTDSPRDGLFAMMDGTAVRPFVYRRLAPVAVSAVTGLIERAVPSTAVDAYLDKSTLKGLYPAEPALTQHQLIALHVAYHLVWLALLLTVVAGAALLRSVRECSWFEGLVSACLAISLLPLTLGNGGYIYDSVELLLWTTLLCCVAQQWSWTALVVFALALLNKESTLAVVPALFPLYARNLGVRGALKWTSLLAVASAAWLVFIRHEYEGVPGEAQEWRLLLNLEFWSQPTSYFKFAAMFAPGLPAPRGANLLVLLLLAIPVRFGWPHLRKDFKFAALLAAAALIPLFLASGCLDETRVLGPLFPFLVVAVSEGLRRLLGEPPVAEGRARSGPDAV